MVRVIFRSRHDAYLKSSMTIFSYAAIDLFLCSVQEAIPLVTDRGYLTKKHSAHFYLFDYSEALKLFPSSYLVCPLSTSLLKPEYHVYLRQLLKNCFGSEVPSLRASTVKSESFTKREVF